MTRFLKPRAVYLAGLGLLAVVTVDLMRRFRKPGAIVIERPAVASQPSETPTAPQPTAKPTAIAYPTTPPAAKSKTVGGDDLTQIKGIGPTYAKRLQDAGLTTYTDLANASADDLRNITRATGSDPADWINEARSLNGH